MNTNESKTTALLLDCVSSSTGGFGGFTQSSVAAINTVLANLSATNAAPVYTLTQFPVTTYSYL